MKKWRPPGWKNPYPTDRAPYVQECVNKGKIYEAGADDILESLWKLAEESPTKTFIIDSRTMTISVSYVKE